LEISRTMRKLAVLSLVALGTSVAVACGGSDGEDSTFTPPPTDEAGTVETPPPAPFGTQDATTPDAPVTDAGSIDCDADPAACLPPAVCGDGKPGLGESCDDKNTADGDGCSAKCQIEAPYWACAFGEKCVDVRDCEALVEAGLAGDGGCTPPPKPIVCGDGFIDPGEACDDGNKTGGDGCSLDCSAIEANYACPTPGAKCVSTMVCGDGFVTGTEQCDDKNTVAGDGCSSTCALEPGWVCPVPGVSCNAAACGDGKVAGAEECDDGNVNNNDGCSSTCKLQTTTVTTAPSAAGPGSTKIENWHCPTPGVACQKTVCGNGVREGTEQCDDGAAGKDKPYDGCTPDCQWEPTCPNGKCNSRCGDGLLFDFDANGDGTIDEECDDGNTRNGDGCSATCKKETGYDCTTAVEADPAFLDVPVVLRDFTYANGAGADKHPDFESYGCAIASKGLVNTSLASGVPTFRWNGVGTDPAGVDGNGTCGQQLTSSADFAQWYTDASTRSKRVDGTMIRLVRKGAAGDYSYVFDSDTDEPYLTRKGFYPLDGKGWNDTGKDAFNVNHNFAFTTELRFWFTYDSSKSPELIFSGDDDVWVFVNGKLALDLGGLHPRLQDSFVLNPAKAGTLGLVNGHVYEIALFHAERHTNASNFKLTLRGFVKKKSVCANVCGDGVKTKEEQCDNGGANTNSGAYGSCRLDCKLGPYCGDKVTTNPPEACDDGTNLTSWAPTSASGKCAPLCKAPTYCGDGMVQGSFGEKCDDGAANNTGAYGKCKPDCTPGPRCGDALVQAGEQCDNGFNVSDYVKHPTATDCAPSCKAPRKCGDGVVDFPFEQCDKGAANTNSGAYGSCTTECTYGPRCGDGIVQAAAGENCDDGNRLNGDGCSAACTKESGGPN